MRYRDERFHAGAGPGTHRREVRAVTRLLHRAKPRPGSRPGSMSVSVSGPWLDLPSGTGRLSDLLPGPVVRVDREPTMLAAAGRGHLRVCASGQSLPFASDAFAGSLCMRLLQHLPRADERVRILRELRRVTAGPIIVSFFHSVCIQHARRLLARRLGKPVSGRSAITLRQFCCDTADAGLRPAAIASLWPFVSEQWLALLVRV